LGTAALFILTDIYLSKLSTNVSWTNALPNFAKLVFFLCLASFLIATLVIDLEWQIIPDQFVFAGLVFAILFILLSNADNFYTLLLSGLSSSLFLLLVHLFTRGKGMGLGDVKLALVLAGLLGCVMGASWAKWAIFVGENSALRFWYSGVVGCVIGVFGAGLWVGIGGIFTK